MAPVDETTTALWDTGHLARPSPLDDNLYAPRHMTDTSLRITHRLPRAPLPADGSLSERHNGVSPADSPSIPLSSTTAVMAQYPRTLSSWTSSTPPTRFPGAASRLDHVGSTSVVASATPRAAKLENVIDPSDADDARLPMYQPWRVRHSLLLPSARVEMQVPLSTTDEMHADAPPLWASPTSMEAELDLDDELSESSGSRPSSGTSSTASSTASLSPEYIRRGRFDEDGYVDDEEEQGHGRDHDDDDESDHENNHGDDGRHDDNDERGDNPPEDSHHQLEDELSPLSPLSDLPFEGPYNLASFHDTPVLKDPWPTLEEAGSTPRPRSPSAPNLVETAKEGPTIHVPWATYTQEPIVYPQEWHQAHAGPSSQILPSNTHTFHERTGFMGEYDAIESPNAQYDELDHGLRRGQVLPALIGFTPELHCTDSVSPTETCDPWPRHPPEPGGVPLDAYPLNQRQQIHRPTRNMAPASSVEEVRVPWALYGSEVNDAPPASPSRRRSMDLPALSDDVFGLLGAQDEDTCTAFTQSKTAYIHDQPRYRALPGAEPDDDLLPRALAPKNYVPDPTAVVQAAPAVGLGLWDNMRGLGVTPRNGESVLRTRFDDDDDDEDTERFELDPAVLASLPPDAEAKRVYALRERHRWAVGSRLRFWDQRARSGPGSAENFGLGDLDVGSVGGVREREREREKARELGDLLRLKLGLNSRGTPALRRSAPLRAQSKPSPASMDQLVASMVFSRQMDAMRRRQARARTWPAAVTGAITVSSGSDGTGEAAGTSSLEGSADAPPPSTAKTPRSPLRQMLLPEDVDVTDGDGDDGWIGMETLVESPSALSPLCLPQGLEAKSE